MLNCVHIWSVDFFFVKNKGTRKEFDQCAVLWNWQCSKCSCPDSWPLQITQGRSAYFFPWLGCACMSRKRVRHRPQWTALMFDVCPNHLFTRMYSHKTWPPPSPVSPDTYPTTFLGSQILKRPLLMKTDCTYHRERVLRGCWQEWWRKRGRTSATCPRSVEPCAAAVASTPPTETREEQVDATERLVSLTLNVVRERHKHLKSLKTLLSTQNAFCYRSAIEWNRCLGVVLARDDRATVLKQTWQYRAHMNVVLG